MKRRLLLHPAGVVALASLLAGCVAGPDYVKPAPPMPATWKLESPWRASAPDDTSLKGPWWQRYGDPRLDALESQALDASPNLALASARLAQARAQLAGVSGARYPQIGISGRGAREKISADRPLSGYATPNFSTVQNEASLSLTVNYEVDLAGRVRRTIEGARASAEQSAADLENTRLLLTTDLATAYFNLRGTDDDIDVVMRSIALQRRALDFVSSRHDLGAASGLEVAQQQALLDNTLAQVDLLQKQRAQYEHAAATLTGAAAPTFSIAADPKAAPVPPAIPLGVPSDVLERRPDVASAERAMAAANAQIGVASAAFYPSVILGPQYGVDSNILGNLFQSSSVLWALGVNATQTIFDGGRIRANVDFTKAGYDATVATYRRTVLTAMQEVEDGITGLADLDRATDQAHVAVTSARRVFDLATARYEGGATSYLDVITAQQGVLSSERQASQIQSQRLLTSVFLVKALGGGWDGPAKLAQQ